MIDDAESENDEQEIEEAKKPGKFVMYLCRHHRHAPSPPPLQPTIWCNLILIVSRWYLGFFFFLFSLNF